MSKHTPGPWIVVGEADPEIHGPDGIWITNQVCSGAGDEGDDGMANAQLIAACPDLLAACKELRAAFLDGCGDATNGPKRERLVKAGAAMDAVIIKAEGK